MVLGLEYCRYDWEEHVTQIDLDKSALTNLPHFIAVSYQRFLEAKAPKEQVEKGLHVYNLVLRMLTIGLVSQYLIRDKERVSDPYLNELLLQKFSHLTLDAWQQLFFTLLRAYEGKQELLFMPELYDFYWDVSVLPHERRGEIEQPFERLTQVTVELQTGRVLPQSEKEWVVLAQEIGKVLRKILQAVMFIGEYDLVRVLSYDKVFYDCELHKGLHVSVGRESLPKHIQFSRGWFYLRRDFREFLLLHPLLVFWKEDMLAERDTGLYDRFVYAEQLQYLLATLNKRGLDDESVRAFVTLLYDTIEEVKFKRQKAEKLTWWQLCDICADVTTRRMAAVQDRYRDELYVQRDATRQSFEKFLESDKRCFVLIGKSGVGKSSFLLALGKELEMQSNIAVLMYDGAQLKLETSLTDVINQNFDDQLVLAGRRVQHIWREITKIDGIADRLVILIVDAVNENSQAQELLMQLNELIQGPWPWLKVVFSSRPETWHTIKRGIKLAGALYYREARSEAIGVELEPYSRQELPEAYAKHQKVFNLQTEYGDLSFESREMLKEPLNLWLMSKSHEGNLIPTDLKLTELVEQYLNALLKSERLWEKDLRFLEKRLVPLMTKQRHYINAISSVDIDVAGEGLYEAVYSEQMLSDGHRINESFTNLVDAEILVAKREGREQSVAFKYERFYEYFVGKALFEELGPDSSWQEKYETWITLLPQAPYLWGAIKNCLRQHLQELQTEQCATLCVELARVSNQRMLEILIAALTEYGTVNRDKIREVAKKMLDKGKSWFGSILRREAVTVQCPAWKRVAISVALNLGMKDLLKLALTDPSSAVRAVAARNTFIYWRREREAGFKLLEDLINRLKGNLGLPNFRVLESSGVLSLLMLFYDFKNDDTVSRLRDIWRDAIELLLRVDPKRLGGRWERIKSWIRTRLLQIVVGVVVNKAKEIPSYNLFTIPEMRLFFKEDGDLERRRKAARMLVEYMDVEEKDVWEVRDDLLDLVNERDVIIALLAATMLKRQVVTRPESSLPLVKNIFDSAIKNDEPGPFGIVIPSRAIVAEAHFVSKSLYMDMMTKYLDQFQGKCWAKLHVVRSSYLDAVYCLESADVADGSLTPTVERYLERMIVGKDYGWLEDFIRLEVTTQAVEIGNLDFSLGVLEKVVHVEEPVIREAVIESLARTRTYYPDEVDDFIEANDLDESFAMAIRTRAPSETIGDLLDFGGLMFWEAVQSAGSSEFWQRLIEVCGRIPECNNLGQWLVFVLKFLVEEIYGESVFVDDLV